MDVCLFRVVSVGSYMEGLLAAGVVLWSCSMSYCCPGLNDLRSSLLGCCLAETLSQ